MAFSQAWAANAENEFPVDVSTANSLTTVSGRAIVVGVACNSFNTITDGDVTDNKGNTYTRIATVFAPTGASGALFYCGNITGGASHTIRFQRGDSSQGSIVAIELKDVTTGVDLLDVSASTSNQTGATFSVGATTDGIATLVGFFVADDPGTWAAGGSYTSRSTTDDSGSRSLIETWDNRGSGSQTATASKGASMGYAGVFAAFKEVSASSYSLACDSGVYSLSGTATVLRIGSQVVLRHRK